MKAWVIEQREAGQNQHYRQDVLCLFLCKNVIQATRTEVAKQLPDSWWGHSCIGDIRFNSLDDARRWAKEMGYSGVLL
ncbi:MAG TPA: hypothetical protein VF077_13070 [Nitrospiraceae bacterium]